jgi:hypothetical protein
VLLGEGRIGAGFESWCKVREEMDEVACVRKGKKTSPNPKIIRPQPTFQIVVLYSLKHQTSDASLIFV